MKRVLICDDEPHILEALRYIVEEEGFEAVEAKDGEEAVERALADRPALVFLDIMMPKMDGYDVCQRLRGSTELRDVHIVMLTARAQDEDQKRALSVGADEYITKPFSPRKLKELLHRVLGD